MSALTGLGRNAAVMAAGTATSRGLGVIRAAVLVAAIGLNVRPADSFALANWLPNLLYMLIAGGVLNAVLVPQVVRAYRSADGQQYVDRLLTLGTVLLLGVTAVLTLASPVIVWIAADQGDPAFTSLATTFALWCIPQVFFYGMYTLLGQVLNARGNFGPYMWAPVANNVVAIAGLVTFIVLFGRYVPGGGGTEIANWDSAMVAVLAGTATLGVVVQALVLVFPLYRSGFRFRPRWDWRGAGLNTAGRVAGWTFAALLVGQIGILIVMRIASAASQEADSAAIAGNAAYTHAFTIFMLPHSLITVSLLTALFTRLSDHAAARDTKAVRTDFSIGLRTTSVFTVFAAVCLSVLALPLVRVVLPSASAAEASSLAPVIVALVAGLVALGAWSLCQRVFYAYEDAKGLFRIQVVMACTVGAGSLAGYLLLPARWWVAAAGASIAASYFLGAVWGGAQVWNRLGGGPGPIIRLHVRAILAAGAAAAVGWPLSLVFGSLSTAGFPKALAVCVLVGSVMLASYLALLRLLGVAEAEDLLRPVLARLRRSRKQPVPAPPVEVDLDAPDGVIGRGTLLAGRYRLHQPLVTDLPETDSWTARDQILDRPVRALLLHSKVQPAQDAARRATLVSDLRLLRILDVGDHEGLAYVVTEPVVGQDLARLTLHGPLPADQARAVVGEAAVALEVARRRGVHHLALRPSTLHVTPDDSVLVTGLGIDGELFGSTVSGARETTRADAVGLVCLLYLALTGRWPELPGGPANPGAPVAPTDQGRPVPPTELNPGVPADLDTLCTVTLGPYESGPNSPAELVQELAPWGPIRAQGIFDAVDAAEASVASGPPSPIADADDFIAQSAAGWTVATITEHELGLPAEEELGLPADDEAGAEELAEDDAEAQAEPEPADVEPPTTEVPAPPADDEPAADVQADAGAGAEPEPDADASDEAAADVQADAGAQAEPEPAAQAGDEPAADVQTESAAVEPPATVAPPQLTAPAAVPHVMQGRSLVTEAVVPRPSLPAATPARPEAIGPLPADWLGDQEFDSLVASPAKPQPRRVSTGPVFLAIVAAVLLFGLIFAWTRLTAPAPPIGGPGGLIRDVPTAPPTTPEGQTGDSATTEDLTTAF